MLERGHVRNREFGEDASEVSTTLAGPADLGGPSAAITTPADSFVHVFASGELRATVGDADVYLYEPTLLPSGVLILTWGTSTYTQVYTAGAFASTTAIGSPLIVPAPAGVWTFSFRYGNSDGPGTSFFRNRKLYLEVF